MKKNFKGGFTLIELLVVIAIIGILASVVLASLNTARNKGADAKIKAELANARAQAELYYDTKGDYEGVCAALSTANPGGISNLVSSAAKSSGGSTATVGTDATAFAYGTTGGTGNSTCHDTTAGWAAIVSLKVPATPSSGWCVDSSQNSKEATVLTNASILCGA
jgi:prepilin-type N-terminal cleavage/methylation domain-containing protein